MVSLASDWHNIVHFFSSLVPRRMATGVCKGHFVNCVNCADSDFFFFLPADWEVCYNPTGSEEIQSQFSTGAASLHRPAQRAQSPWCRMGLPEPMQTRDRVLMKKIIPPLFFICLTTASLPCQKTSFIVSFLKVGLKDYHCCWINNVRDLKEVSTGEKDHVKQPCLWTLETPLMQWHD